jgi:REP element-mobilizing transposase RayT
MSDKYKMRETDKAYFVTLTVVDWLDVFTHKNHKLKLVESIIYCQKHKGLEIYGWCLMTNHLHMIAKAVGQQTLPEILRDFKNYIAKVIIQQIEEEPESRKAWMLARFKYNGKYLKRIEKYKFWQDGNHAEKIYSNKIFYQKLDYIHNNPVKELIVTQPEDYYFSSARNYAGLDFVLPVVLETVKLRTY